MWTHTPWPVQENSCSLLLAFRQGAKVKTAKDYFFAHLNVGKYNLDIIKTQETLKEAFYLCSSFNTQLLPIMDKSKCHLIRNIMS